MRRLGRRGDRAGRAHPRRSTSSPPPTPTVHWSTLRPPGAGQVDRRPHRGRERRRFCSPTTPCSPTSAPPGRHPRRVGGRWCARVLVVEPALPPPPRSRPATHSPTAGLAPARRPARPGLAVALAGRHPVEPRSGVVGCRHHRHPAGKIADHSGDWHYAGASSTRSRAGIDAVRQPDRRVRSWTVGRDVHVVLRGSNRSSVPRPGPRALGFISHPDALTVAECATRPISCSMCRRLRRAPSPGSPRRRSRCSSRPPTPTGSDLKRPTARARAYRRWANTCVRWASCRFPHWPAVTGPDPRLLQALGRSRPDRQHLRRLRRPPRASTRRRPSCSTTTGASCGRGASSRIPHPRRHRGGAIVVSDHLPEVVERFDGAVPTWEDARAFAGSDAGSPPSLRRSGSGPTAPGPSCSATTPSMITGSESLEELFRTPRAAPPRRDPRPPRDQQRSGRAAPRRFVLLAGRQPRPVGLRRRGPTCSRRTSPSSREDADSASGCGRRPPRRPGTCGLGRLRRPVIDVASTSCTLPLPACRRRRGWSPGRCRFAGPSW